MQPPCPFGHLEAHCSILALIRLKLLTATTPALPREPLLQCAPYSHIFGQAVSSIRLSLSSTLDSPATTQTGAFLYAQRIPERFWPGTLNFFGNSHQIFHVLIVLVRHFIPGPSLFSRKTTACIKVYSNAQLVVQAEQL